MQKNSIFTFKPIVNSFFSKNISIGSILTQRSSLPSNLRAEGAGLRSKDDSKDLILLGEFEHYQLKTNNVVMGFSYLSDN